MNDSSYLNEFRMITDDFDLSSNVIEDGLSLGAQIAAVYDDEIMNEDLKTMNQQTLIWRDGRNDHEIYLNSLSLTMTTTVFSLGMMAH